MEADGKLKLKIGIIGGGISGAASAYFLHQLFGERVDLVVFEKTDRVGGRLNTIDFEHRDYECGGSILHSSNLYMRKFVDLCGLKEKSKPRDWDECVVLCDDQTNILLHTDGKFFGLLDIIRMCRHFGFFQLRRFRAWVTDLVFKFGKIYRLQESGFVFNDLESFVTSMDPFLYKMSQQSLRKSLEELKFNDKIINELASIACLSNYNQSIDIDGFTGMVSLAACTGKLWSVKNGNKQVPKCLLEKSEAKVLLSTQVKLVSKSPSDPDSKNLIVYQTSDNEEISDNSFDYVLIAFPIHSGNFKDIQLEINEDNDHNDTDQFADQHMQLTNTYFIHGKVKMFTGSLPDTKRLQLHCVDPDNSYRTCCVQLPCDYSNDKDSELYMNPGPKLYKIFAEKNLDKKIFDEMFEQGYEIRNYTPWLAYPKYDKNPTSKKIPRVRLDSSERSRVMYLNSLEWSSSCMEICAISAKNVVNMIWQKENNKTVADGGKKMKRFFHESDYLEAKEWQRTFHRICGLGWLFLFVSFLFAVYSRLS